MNKKSPFNILLAAVIFGALSVAQVASATRVAVIDFESIGDDAYVGRAVTEIVRTELIKTGKYEVVERALLNKLLEEQRFQLSDLVDPTKAVELGKMLGADLILTGSVVKIGTNYTINARFIDVKTGAATRAEAIQGYNIDELTYMSIKLIGILEQKVMPTPETSAPVTRPAPALQPERRPERPYIPLPSVPKAKPTPRSYLTFSVGEAGFAMEELNDAMEGMRRYYGGSVESIEGGLNLDFSGGMMASEKIGIGLSTSFLKGTGNLDFAQGVKLDVEVIGVTFAFRTIYRQEFGDNLAFCLGTDIGLISLTYRETTENFWASEENEGTGVGPLFGAFASGQMSLGKFFLQGDMGFRSAKGDVDLDSGGSIELDFSGGYLLLTGGLRF